MEVNEINIGWALCQIYAEYLLINIMTNIFNVGALLSPKGQTGSLSPI